MEITKYKSNKDFDIFLPRSGTEAAFIASDTNWNIVIIDNNKWYDKFTKAWLLKPYIIIFKNKNFLKSIQKDFPKNDISKVLFLVNYNEIICLDKNNKNIKNFNLLAKKLDIDKFVPYTDEEKQKRYKQWTTENFEDVKKQAEEDLISDLNYAITVELEKKDVTLKNYDNVIRYLRNNYPDDFNIKIIKNSEEAKAQYIDWDSEIAKKHIISALKILNVINESKKKKHWYFGGGWGHGYWPDLYKDNSDDDDADSFDGDDGGGGDMGESFNKGKNKMNLLKELNELLDDEENFDGEDEEGLDANDKEKDDDEEDFNLNIESEEQLDDKNSEEYNRAFEYAQRMFNESLREGITKKIENKENVDPACNDVEEYLNQNYPDLSFSVDTDSTGEPDAIWTVFDKASPLYTPGADEALTEALYMNFYLSYRDEKAFELVNPTKANEREEPELDEAVNNILRFVK